MHKWKNWVGLFATVVLLTVSSCSSSTPAPTAPPPPPPPAAPPPPAVQQKIVLRGVHFDFGKYQIRTGDAAVLDEAITILKANPHVVIYVNGYCDSIGDADSNQKLSEYRANAVTNYLLNGGINVLQLRVLGYGSTNFVATNKTEEGRAQNRRVELVPQQ